MLIEVLTRLLMTCLTLLCLQNSGAQAQDPADLCFHRPGGIAILDHPRRAIISNESSGTITFVPLADVNLAAATQSSKLAESLLDVAAVPGNQQVLVATANPSAVLRVDVKGDSAVVTARYPLGSVPTRIAVTQSGRFAVVSSMWAKSIDIICLSEYAYSTPGKQKDSVQRINLPFAPREVLPLDNDFAVVFDGFGGEFAVVNLNSETATEKTDTLNTSSPILFFNRFQGHHIGGVFFDESSDEILITHQILSRTAQTSRGDLHWGTLMQNVVRRLPRSSLLHHDTNFDETGSVIMVGSIGRGAADLAGIVVADRTIVTASSGTNQLIAAATSDSASKAIQTGTFPDRIARISDSMIIVTNKLDNTVQVFRSDLRQMVRQFGRPPQSLTDKQLGERAFFDASLSHDGWMSCASCHVHGHTPDLKADTKGDGHYGAPKRIPSLLGVYQTAPFGWIGNQPTLEQQLRQTLTTTMHGDSLDRARPENTAETTDEYLATHIKRLANYLGTLDVTEAHTGRVGDGALKAAGHALSAGQSLFNSAGCRKCHDPDLYYTSPVRVDVGVEDEWGNREFNPPSLRHLHLRRAFFHDGRFTSLEELLEKHPQPAAELTSEQRTLLIDFLLRRGTDHR
ncbi:MAG: hypothetical protein JNL58_05160 [Planctomyces sp.]|nr:hypothetical protein [Planctomyces sp.]